MDRDSLDTTLQDERLGLRIRNELEVDRRIRQERASQPSYLELPGWLDSGVMCGLCAMDKPYAFSPAAGELPVDVEDEIGSEAERGIEAQRQRHRDIETEALRKRHRE